VFKVEHNLTDPAEYPYDKQYEISLIKLKLARYYQLSLWVLTHVSYVKKRHLKGTESCKKWNHATA
jgi:hypothetical protein